ncbi:MAG: hypothetical protein H6728_00355 [Myxococcales bacterium]|nr:hypothetical protein [Myxococcales bacterium]
MFRLACCGFLILFATGFACGAPPCLIDGDCLAGWYCDPALRLCRLSLCKEGDTRSCFSGSVAQIGQGVCRAGSQRCDATGHWGTCQGEITPSLERCEPWGVDEDCDGKADESCELRRCGEDTFLGLRVTPQKVSEGWSLEVAWPEGNERFAWDVVPEVKIIAGRWTIQQVVWEKQRPQILVVRLVPSLGVEPFRISLSGVAAQKVDGTWRTYCEGSWDSQSIVVGCAEGTTLCDGSCVDTSKEPSHCGACGKICEATKTCCAGQCVSWLLAPSTCLACAESTCVTGEGCCDGSCTPLDKEDHCGGCGVRCMEGMRCCGSCVDTKNDPKHCGACGNACLVGEQCCQGRCVSVSAQETCGGCGGSCSKGACGSCGGTPWCGGKSCVACRRALDCAPDQVCRQGKCIACPSDASCDAFWVVSSSSYADVQSVVWDAQKLVFTGMYRGTVGVGSKSLSQAKGDDLFLAAWSGGATSGLVSVGGERTEKTPLLASASPALLYWSGVVQGKDFSVFRENPSPILVSRAPADPESNRGLLFVTLDEKLEATAVLSIEAGQDVTLRSLQVVPGLGTQVLLGAEVVGGMGSFSCNGQSLQALEDSGTEVGKQLAFLWVDAKERRCLRGALLGRSTLPSLASWEVADDGGSLAFGSFQGTFETSLGKLQAKGDRDIFVLRWSPDGQLLWQQVLGGAAKDEARYAVLLEGGFSILAGSFEGAFEVGKQRLETFLDRDIFLVALNAVGKPSWSLQLGAQGTNEEIIAIKRDPVGGVYVLGSFTGTTRLGWHTLTSYGGKDLFLARISLRGEVLSVVHLGGEGDEVGLGLFVGPDGVAVSGRFQGGALRLGNGSVLHTETMDGLWKGFVWTLRP